MGHLGKQNVVKLAGMSECINLSQPPLSNIYILYTRSTLQLETHVDLPLADQGGLDSVHSDVIGQFPPTSNEIGYVVIFLDDDIKESKVNFLQRKSEVFHIFQFYLAWNERGDLQNHRFCIDGKEEYESNEWTTFKKERDILWESIIPKNLQQNSSAKWLG